MKAIVWICPLRWPVLLHRKVLHTSYAIKRHFVSGCALARKVYVAKATALGARVLQARLFLVIYRGLVARGPAGSAIKRIADEAILSDFGGMFSSFTHHYSVK